MKELISGKKLTYHGKYYHTQDVQLFSPPLHRIPVLLAAGGPKTAVLGAEFADGLIISVKDPEVALTKVIMPAQEITTEMKKKAIMIACSRWTVFAQSEEEAWKALKPWRGLRAPERDKAHHPKVLQQAADKMPKKEIISRFTIVSSPSDYIQAYSPLIENVKSDIVVIQTTALHQEKIISLLGKKVVPKLKSLRG